MTEVSDNSRTLRAYSNKINEYIGATPAVISESESAWLEHALRLIPDRGKVLEIGAGFGRNAQTIQEKGYDITSTDAVPEFVALLKEKGFKASLLNALQDPLGAGYDMVFANGVLIHFTSEEARAVIAKVHAALKPGGTFAFSVKQGEGSKWTEEKLGAPRFFQYWQLHDIRQLIEASGFKWVAMYTGHTSLRNASWLYIIAQKGEIT